MLRSHNTFKFHIFNINTFQLFSILVFFLITFIYKGFYCLYLKFMNWSENFTWKVVNAAFLLYLLL